MIRLGFHASHEQFSPVEMLELAREAEAHGFGFVLSSDHIYPWSESQGNSGFAWSWLGAAMQVTTIPFSVVTVPGYRYHPVVLAQAIATLTTMFPGRFDPCMGSGEALNEHITGGKWPQKALRNDILRESVEAMRRLWNGETVTATGNVHIEDAKLYVLPEKQPVVYGAALSEETAEWLGAWADGLVTVADEPASVERRVRAFRKGGGTGKPLILKAQLSHDVSYDEALKGAIEQWRYALLPGPIMGELRRIDQFEAAGQLVGKDLVEKKVKIIAKPEDSIEWIEQFIGLGFETIVLHNVNRNQRQFIADFGKRVLPHFA